MPRTTRSRTLRTDREAVWRVVSDPYHLARWWPRVARVEAVRERTHGRGTRWTNVLRTRTGRDLRIDLRCLYSREPDGYAWEQEVADSPFEKVLRSAVTTLDLSEAEDGTRITLRLDQRLRGLSRFGGGVMLRRAAAKQLEQALDGLERALGTPGTEQQPRGDDG